MKTRTFAMVKPDGVERGHIGDVIKRIEQKGLTINGMKLIQVTSEQAKQHYKAHAHKSFYPELVAYLTSGPVVAIVVSGNHAVELMRLLAGATDPLKAQVGTIRGDFGMDVQNNIIHTSDSIEHANEEIAIYFPKEEIIDYHLTMDKWTSH